MSRAEELAKTLKLVKLSELTPRELELYYRKKALWGDPVRRRRAIESVYRRSKEVVELGLWGGVE
jgi:hypothetical protein